MAVHRERSRDTKKWRDVAVPGDYVRLSKVAVSIVDTPLFQRLRYLKQLGLSDFVYPGASHTRFAHSLGVAHRAKEFALRLAAKQPELLLTDSDLVVLEVAGLCHDLGHGPFSHCFESELVPRLLPAGEEWEHEAQSCRLLDHLCATYHIDLTPGEQQRVKDLIMGDREAAQGDWAGKEWQFDIVANKRNGLDVDKLDYLRRDNAACGELTASEFSALYENMRVIGGEVCFRSSVRSAVQEVYAARAKMHEFVYTHAVCKAVEFMVIDALLAAADELGILEALRDPERFALLDDTILRDIERSRSQTPGMQRAQELLRRLRHRDIYKYAGSADIPRAKVATFRRVEEREMVEQQDPECPIQLTPEDIRVHNLKIDYTQHHANPLSKVGLYVNEDDPEPFYPSPDDVPFAPGTFVTRQVRVYLVRLCESPEEKQQYLAAVQRAFGRWCKRVLEVELWMSPRKSAVTASARKRQRPGSSVALNEQAAAAEGGGGGGGEGGDRLAAGGSQASEPGSSSVSRAGGAAADPLAGARRHLPL